MHSSKVARVVPTRSRSVRQTRGGRFAIVAVIAAILAVGAALYERSAARGAKAAMLAESRAFEVAQSQARGSAQRDEAANRSQDGIQPAGQAGPPDAGAPGARPANPKSGPSAADQKADWQRFLALHPEVHDVLDAYAKREFAHEFGAFFKSAGLTAAQADQVESITFEKWFANLGIGPQGNIRSGDEVLLPPVEQLRGILGDQGAQQLEDYNRAMPAQGVVNQIAAKAGFASAPLSPEQASQLAQVMAANSPEYAAGKSVNVSTVDWAATSNQVGAFLSPAQAQAAQRQILILQYQFALAQARQAAGGSK